MGVSRRLLAVLTLAVLAGCSGAAPGTPAAYDGTVQPPADDPELVPSGTERVDVEVIRVVDGDTVDVRFPDGTEDTVRLVGIDTPEVGGENDPGEYEGVPDTDAGAACLRAAGVDASEHVTDRIDDGNVTIAFDPNTDRRGGYDRLLAYVYVGDANLNYELVATGRARVYETDFALRERFETAAERARDGDRGLWACRDGA